MYNSLRDCANDLEKTGQLIRIKHEVDANLEMAEIHRRFYDSRGPAVLFENIKGKILLTFDKYYSAGGQVDQEIKLVDVKPTDRADVLLAMAGKLSSDLQAIIQKRPEIFAALLRELSEQPDHAILKIVREVKDGDW